MVDEGLSICNSVFSFPTMCNKQLWASEGWAGGSALTDGTTGERSVMAEVITHHPDHNEVSIWFYSEISRYHGWSTEVVTILHHPWFSGMQKGAVSPLCFREEGLDFGVSEVFF
jgi:hypothetical protein